jgi:cytochrome b561
MLFLHDQEEMKMLKQRQWTRWGTGMNPTGLYTHLFVFPLEGSIFSLELSQNELTLFLFSIIPGVVPEPSTQSDND